MLKQNALLQPLQKTLVFFLHPSAVHFVAKVYLLPFACSFIGYFSVKGNVLADGDDYDLGFDEVVGDNDG